MNQPNPCLLWSQSRINFLLLFLIVFYIESAAAWYQVNLFKNRNNWWNRADIGIPTDILLRETSGYTCITANRPIGQTVMDAVVIWNRPETKSTVVKAIAFYDDELCGTSPDPLGQLPWPSVILVLDLDNLNAISAFNFAIQNIQFTWGSYRAFDLARERQTNRALAQFTGVNLSGSIILRRTDTGPGPFYREPIRGMQAFNDEKYRVLTKSQGVNALMRHLGEMTMIPLLPQEYRSSNDGRIEVMGKLLMAQLNRYIEEEQSKGQGIRQSLSGTSAAGKGTSALIQGPSMPQMLPSTSEFGPQQGTYNAALPYNPLFGTGYNPGPTFQAPNSNTVQKSPNFNSPSLMNVPPPGTVSFPTYNTLSQSGQVLQNIPREDLPSQGSFQQESSPQVNFRPQSSPQGILQPQFSPRRSLQTQGGIPNLNLPKYNTSPNNPAQDIDIYFNTDNTVPYSGEASNTSPVVNPEQPSFLSQSGQREPLNSQINLESLGGSNSNTGPGASSNIGMAEEIQPNSQQPPNSDTQDITAMNTQSIPNQNANAIPQADQAGQNQNSRLREPVTLHPEIFDTLAQRYHPYDLVRRPVDVSAIMQSYYMEPDAKRWYDTYLAMLINTQEVVKTAKNLFDLGQQGKLPPPEAMKDFLRGLGNGSDQLERINQAQEIPQQTQNIIPSGSLSQPPQNTYPSGEAPLTDNRSNSDQQTAPSRPQQQPTQMLVENPLLEPQRQAQIERQPSNPEMSSQGGQLTSQKIQAQRAKMLQRQKSNTGENPLADVQPGEGTARQNTSPQGTFDNQQQIRFGPDVFRSQSLQVQEMPTPGVLRLSVPQGDSQSRPYSQSKTIPRKHSQVPASNLGTERESASTMGPGPQQSQNNPEILNEQGDLSKKGLLQRKNNVNWLQEQKNPFGKQPGPASNIEQSRQRGNGPDTTEQSLEQEGLRRDSKPRAAQSSEAENLVREDRGPPPPRGFTVVVGGQPGTGISIQQPSGINIQNAGNIPPMFQRVPLESNQSTLNRPSVGQLRPSRGSTTSGGNSDQEDALPTEKEEVSIEEEDMPISRPFNQVSPDHSAFDPDLVEILSENDPSDQAEELNLAAANRESTIPGQRDAISQRTNAQQGTVEDPSIGSEVIELDEIDPAVFNRNQNPEIELFRYGYSEEVGSPASVQSVLNDFSRGVPEDVERPIQPSDQRINQEDVQKRDPAPLAEGEIDPQFSDMIREMIWGKPEPALQPLFPAANDLNRRQPEDLTDRELLRPPPMRISQGTQNTTPRADIAAMRQNLEHEYANTLRKLLRIDNEQRQPNAVRIPGYVTPLFLEPYKPNPVVSPFLEEDEIAIPPSALTASIYRDLTPEQIWGPEYKYTDPMMDKEFLQQVLREQREARQQELTSDPLAAWRNTLKTMARFQQRPKARPQDIPLWSGPYFLGGENHLGLDPTGATTQQQLNSLTDPDAYDWDWDEAEKTLVPKKRKMNPSN